MAMEVDDLAELDASLALIEDPDVSAFEAEAAAGEGLSLEGFDGLMLDGNPNLAPIAAVAAVPATALPPVNAGVLAAKNARRPDKKRKSTTGVRKGAASSNKSAAPKSGAAPKKRVDEEDINKNEDEHPFRIGAPLVARFVDGTARLATVIERSCTAAAAASAAAATAAAAAAAAAAGAVPPPAVQPPAEAWRYYLHFIGMNRRMDEWLGNDRIISPPSIAAAELKAQKENKLREKLSADAKADSSAAAAAGAPTDATAAAAAAATALVSAADELAAQKRHHMKPGSAGSGEVVVLHTHDGDDDHEGLDEASLKEHEEVTKVKNVNWIEFGKHIMECWYFSPFPKEYYPDGAAEFLYFCEHSMKFFRHRSELLRWQKTGTVTRHPPGNEIYRDNNMAMFEVDGMEQRQYCQNLCYMAKLFLDHKTLYYDVDPFLFYILCEHDQYGFHPVGYFSKEKYSDLGYNLACILTFPAHQRKGYGRVLISFSYELSKKEEKVGSPEKPLSDLGAVSYRSYWSSVIIDELRRYEGPALSVMELSKTTSIMSDDVLNTLQFLGLLRYDAGQHVIVTAPDVLDALALKYPIKEPRVDPSRLHWTPMLTDNKKDKFSIKSKRPAEEIAGS